MLSQSNGQTVPQFGCSIGKCSDSKVFFVSLIDTGDAKTRLGGGPQVMHWKVARYQFLKALGGCPVMQLQRQRQDFVVNSLQLQTKFPSISLLTILVMIFLLLNEGLTFMSIDTHYRTFGMLDFPCFYGFLRSLNISVKPLSFHI